MAILVAILVTMLNVSCCLFIVKVVNGRGGWVDGADVCSLIFNVNITPAASIYDGGIL